MFIRNAYISIEGDKMKSERDIEEKLKDLNKIIEAMPVNEYIAGWIRALLWVLEDICK